MAKYARVVQQKWNISHCIMNFIQGKNNIDELLKYEHILHALYKFILMY